MENLDEALAGKGGAVESGVVVGIVAVPMAVPVGGMNVDFKVAVEATWGSTDAELGV